jgi:hypothetical protein
VSSFYPCHPDSYDGHNVLLSGEMMHQPKFY